MIIAGPGGSGFLRDAKAEKRSIFLWTVDEVKWMKWSIGKEVDGVITDDPKTYLEVCKNYTGEKIRLPWKTWAKVFALSIVARFFSFLFRSKYGFWVDMKKIKAAMEESMGGST
jgi:phosphatidylglycerol phospholipase C